MLPGGRLNRMTITPQRADAKAPSAWRRMRLWALAHAIDDLYQGLVPSVVPYFVLDRHYGYVAASGLTLAATLGSSIPQPVIGIIADRRNASWQDYLPTRPGTAAGVTLGLGVSIGGLAAPLLALIADAHGPRGALLALLVVPPLALLCGLLLREPSQSG
jgi:MFS transporter, FSR family, fosmidomycin resistance protein